jgi:hypothetical protein
VPNWMERAKTNLGKTAGQGAAIADETPSPRSLDNSPSFPPVECPVTVTVANEDAAEFFDEPAAIPNSMVDYPGKTPKRRHAKLQSAILCQQPE